MAIGAPGSGKSSTIEIISKMLGWNLQNACLESQATAEVIQSLLWKTTVPLCWDDPGYQSTVKGVIILLIPAFMSVLIIRDHTFQFLV